ncbi:MAG: chromosomal replication initiator protein DnaA [Gemmataceae bacterium]
MDVLLESPLQASMSELVSLLERAIAERIGSKSYDLWFRDRTHLSWTEEGITVGVPNRFTQKYYQKTFTEEVAAAASEILGEAVPISFVIVPQLFQASREAQASPTEESPATPADERKSVPQAEPKPKPKKKNPTARRKATRKRRWHTLDDFVVGPCNRVAHASALAVAGNPGLEANPLVVHGPVGTGKTHLLEGIYVGLKRQIGDLNVRYITAEDFTNRFVQAMRFGKLVSFRKYFRDCDALLVDDLHFLASKKATQEEFLHTFDVLHSEARQIVVTCDCHPRLNDDFLPELVDRLLGGGMWGLMPPDFDTRLRLLRAKSVRPDAKPIDEDVLMFVAEKLKGNVRELEGAVNSLYHYSKVANRTIDIRLAQEALGELLRHSVRVIQLCDVDDAVCEILHMQSGSLQTKNRSWAFSHPRMLAMYLARKHTSATHIEVGKYFGKYSHSTVVAAEKKVRKWIDDDHSLKLTSSNVRVRDAIERIERNLLS